MHSEQADEPVNQLASSREVLVVSSVFPSTTPDTLFTYWTQNDRMQSWWPQEAEIEPRNGGAYHLAWPAMQWHLRGHYTTFEPGRQLTFTWMWDHEPDDASMVSVAFLPLGGVGTQLTITHGPYPDTTKGQERRQGHLDGWRHFLAKLHAAVAAPVTSAQ